MIREVCKPWDDVFESKLDERLAPEISEIISKEAPLIYTDAVEFFKRTYFSGSMANAIRNVIQVLKGEGGNNLLIIYSLFGGGKTHTLLTLYHAMNSPSALRHPEVLRDYDEPRRLELENLAGEIEELGDVRLVVVFGKDYRFSGRPSRPLDFGSYKVRTIWGYIGHSLGRYDLVRVDDENLTAPDISTIREVLGDYPIIILMDEIVDYGQNLLGSSDEGERGYASNIPIFLDRLATAILGMRTSLLITLPIEVSEETRSIRKVEERYDVGYVESIWRGIHRAGFRHISPLGGSDVVEVLKKRLFKEIDRNSKGHFMRELEVTLTSNPEVFGSTEGLIDAMEGSYPFHPDFIRIMRDIIERAGLQKTRDLLKLSRVVVRKIWEGDGSPYFIMPYHIDLFDENLRANIFKGHLEAYSIVADRDIGENTKKLAKPELARMIASSIFLKTYIYDSPVPQRMFPRTHEVAVLTYEPSAFRDNNWIPSDILDCLDEISSRTHLVYLQTKDGVFWFWRIASVKEQIELLARRILEESYERCLGELAETVKKYRFGERPRRGRRRREEVEVKVFSKEECHVTSDPDDELVDDDRYKSIILVRPNVSDDVLYKLLFRYRDGERTYKNTIAVLYPNSEETFRRCMSLTATLLACDEVASKLRELYSGMSRDVIEVQRGLINNVKSSTEGDLEEAVLSTFTAVAYPRAGEGIRPEVGKVSAYNVSGTLIENIFLALTSPPLEKVAESLSFENLERYIREVMEVNLSEGEKDYAVSNIKGWFKTNPAFPMVEDGDIEEAIKEGIRRLKVGISDGKVRYKKVYKEVPALTVDEGDVPETLDDSDKVLPWRKALEIQVNSLLEMEGTEEVDGRLIKRWYEVNYEGTNLLLRDLPSKEDWHELVKDGFIIEKEKEIPPEYFEVSLEPSMKKVKPDEEVEVKVKVKLIKGERINITITPEIGTVEPSEAILTKESPVDALWKFKAPTEGGMHSFNVTVKSARSFEEKQIILEIETNIEVTKELKKEHIGALLLEVNGIEEEGAFNVLTSLGEIGMFGSGEFSISRDEAEISSELRKLDISVISYLIGEVKEILEGEASFKIDVSVPGGVEITPVLYQKLSSLNGKVEFKLRKRR